MYILGISAFFHDSAACLLKDDVIVAAAQEERFTRKKNDERFPASAVRYCLQEGGIGLNEVDYLVFYEKPFLKFERLIETYLSFAPKGFLAFMKSMPLWLKEKLFLKKKLLQELKKADESLDIQNINLLFSTHHLSHAASAFYPSPFDSAVILTADGVGEWTTTSVSFGEGNSIKFHKEIEFPHSIGLLYSAFTYYLGFKVNCDEYKVMGLAPYGEPIFVDLIFKHLVNLKLDGSFRLNLKYFSYCTGLTMTGSAFEQLFGNPRREPSASLTRFHMDVARSIQTVTERIMLMITYSLFREFQVSNLCLAGGVALNCVANSKILQQSGFKNIWIPPAAGDAGGALGAAYAVYYDYLENSRHVTLPEDKMQNALLGPSLQDNDIKTELVNQKVKFEELTEDNYYNAVADEIAKGKVVGYFRGRMEFGPRALGSRSILADPRDHRMQSILNQKIKFRESFRPFAPAILEEHASSYFDIVDKTPYMLLVADVASAIRFPPENQAVYGFDLLKQARSTIPAVTHVDFSARVQTVGQYSHPDFYNLINAFYKITGCPLVINTSFNRMDEPIVNSVSEALACFRQTGMDVLVIGSFLIRKEMDFDD
ncbi:carbamoyltransferase [Mucilaginibacter sp.]|uniref:carbamoyltransferase family protein n=1 Tax=Mucilaginibacter sp. TaxID=1882438 RepID=UPI002ED53C9B